MVESMNISLSLKDGEDGIRTHVPVKANGFQDRLVMTTSIPLRTPEYDSTRYYKSQLIFRSAGESRLRQLFREISEHYVISFTVIPEIIHVRVKPLPVRMFVKLHCQSFDHNGDPPFFLSQQL